MLSAGLSPSFHPSISVDPSLSHRFSATSLPPFLSLSLIFFPLPPHCPLPVLSSLQALASLRLEHICRRLGNRAVWASANALLSLSLLATFPLSRWAAQASPPTSLSSSTCHYPPLAFSSLMSCMRYAAPHVAVFHWLEGWGHTKLLALLMFALLGVPLAVSGRQ